METLQGTPGDRRSEAADGLPAKAGHDPVSRRQSFARRAGARLARLTGLTPASARQPSPPTLETFFAGSIWDF